VSTLFKVGDTAPNFKFDTPWKRDQDFISVANEKQAVFVFLRYHGCPVCQMEMANFKRDIGLFTDKGVKVFVFLQSSMETLQSLLKQEEWPFEIVSDPKGTLFKKYGVEPGGIIRYLHPRGLVALMKALSRGFMHKKFEGKETQLPAAFIIKSNQTIKYAYYGKTISDIPTPSALASELE